MEKRNVRGRIREGRGGVRTGGVWGDKGRRGDVVVG